MSLLDPNSLFLFDFGGIPIRIWDILDLFIVGLLIFQIYKLLRGSIAFNIFIGVILLYIVYWIVREMEMNLLSSVLSQFVSVGVLMLLIVFQPEVRRFFLLIGHSTLKQRSNFLRRLIEGNINTVEGEEKQIQVEAISKAILNMSKKRIGALIVFTNHLSLEYFSDSGVIIDAQISQLLIESIFAKDSPLHDGAMIISDGKIRAASCVLPLSLDGQGILKTGGLRHRAGVGATENSEVVVFIVSEENGHIAFAKAGNLEKNLDEAQLKERLLKHYH
ncbi:MAG: diadenylate cyclase CdaA [Bacteroidota bacterium]